MAEQRSVQIRLGAAPGRFVVISVILAVVWFPIRLYLDRGDPLAAIIALSGLYGAVWSLMLPVFEWTSRKTANQPRPEIDEDPRRVRRGALVGLGLGVPFYGALLLLCLVTGRSLVYTLGFAVILAGVVAVAVARLATGRRG
jgi:hypothetical protein